MRRMSESARTTSAAQSRFRIQAPNAAPREILVVALDRKCSELGGMLSGQSWNGATFINFQGLGACTDPQSALSWHGFDLVVIVGSAGEDLAAAKAIGSKALACGIKISALLLREAGTTEDEVSAALLELRPWSRTLAVVDSADYLIGALHALGA
jgi:hypothetical protein